MTTSSNPPPEPPWWAPQGGGTPPPATSPGSSTGADHPGAVTPDAAWPAADPAAQPPGVAAPTAGRRNRLTGALRRPHTRVGVALVAAVLVGAAAGVGGTAALDARGGSQTNTSQTDPAATGGTTVPGTGTGSSGTGRQRTFPGPLGGTNDPNAGTRAEVSATDAQSVGVVDIDTVIGYQNAEAAGTGLVVTGSGEILTNNHVIDGATKITVTVVTTGRTYSATVVGTSPSNDIAVLQLSGASGLAIAAFGDSGSVDVGERVTGVGNAGGDGGIPSAAEGTVTALGRTVTASDQSGSDAETLTGIIVTNAAIEAGDSGGPLYDTDNKIVGIDTAAETGANGTTDESYAIPINHALRVAQRIENKQASSKIHIGYPAFLGVALSQASSTTIAEVYSKSPAAKAGLTAGDTITAVNGEDVSSATALDKAIAAHKPGESIRLSWTNGSGTKHTATATLVARPAD